MQSLRPFPGPSESAFPGSLWMSMNIWILESENVGLNLAVSGEWDLVVHLLQTMGRMIGCPLVWSSWSSSSDATQTSATVLIIRSEIKLGKSSSSSTHYPLLPKLHNHKWLWQALRFLLLLNLPFYFLPGPRPWVCPHSVIPTEGCQGQGKTTPWPHSQRTRSQGLSPEVCCTKARAWSPGCFCLVRLLDHKAQSCLCFSGPLPWAGLALGTSFSTSTSCWQLHAGGLPMGGHCLLLQAASSLLFVKAVLQGSTNWCLPQRMTFINSVPWGFAVGAAGPRARREGRAGHSGRWNLAQADVECLLQ